MAVVERLRSNPPLFARHLRSDSLLESTLMPFLTSYSSGKAQPHRVELLLERAIF